MARNHKQVFSRIQDLVLTRVKRAKIMLVAWTQIDPKAPFAKAFKQMRGWEWVSSFVGGGASLGLLTSIMVAMSGQARYLCVIGRSHLVPHWFAVINPSTGTPVYATFFLGTFLPLSWKLLYPSS